MQELNPEANVIEQVVGYATDADGKNIRIVWRVYDQPIIIPDVNAEILPKLHTTSDTYIVENDEPDVLYGKTTFYEPQMTRDQINKEIAYMQNNIDQYKYTPSNHLHGNSKKQELN